MYSADRTKLILEPNNSFDDCLGIFSGKNPEIELHTVLFRSVRPLSRVADFSPLIKRFVRVQSGTRELPLLPLALPSTQNEGYVFKDKCSKSVLIQTRSPSTEREQQIPFNTSCSHRYRLLQ